MLILGTLRLVLLVGTCLCVYGNPVRPPNVNADQSSDGDGRCASSEKTVGSTHTTDGKSEPLGKEHLSGLPLNNGAGAGAGSKRRNEGTEPENGDGPYGRSGPSLTSRQSSSEAEVRSTALALPVDSEGKEEDLPVTSEPMLSSTGGWEQSDVALRTTRLPPDGSLASTASPQIRAAVGEPKVECDEDQRRALPCYGGSLQDKDPATRLPSSPEKLTLHSTIPPPGFTSPRISTLLSIWGHDGATASSLPDPPLPEIEPKLVPREDGPESLWTEAARPGGAGTGVPPYQDEATEGTMSSEALPLIFEPLEDATPEGPPAGAPLVPGSAPTPTAMPPSEVDLDRLDVVEPGGPSNAAPLLLPDWTSPWQTSGAEWLEPIGSLDPSVSPTEDHSERSAVRTPNLKENLPSSGTSSSSSSSSSSFQRAMTTITMSTHEHRSRSGLEEMESEEEPDEDEDDETSEEWVEDESEEDLTETTRRSSTQAPHSLVPPSPVWAQRNRMLMRNWLQLTREKAGYVSGMLAPLGIGITGALLIVGALYSIRMIHRKRRNSFKQQRRKIRQPEQPGEPGIGGQDQAMLLADSSEDEF